jgi:hypothetical protein
MDTEVAQKLLDVLTDNALRILAAGFGLNWAESTFFDVVRLLREEEALKYYFLDRVRSTLAARSPEALEPGTIPTELIELIAHEFRWPELLQIADHRINKFFRGDAAFAVADVATHIRDAFDDNWEDRVFYERYKQ